jgi:hypothetical protein
LLSKNAIIRAGAESQIVPVNAAFRCPRHIDLVKFFLWLLSPVGYNPVSNTSDAVKSGSNNPTGFLPSKLKCPAPGG